jgi:hypothetical protein
MNDNSKVKIKRIDPSELNSHLFAQQKAATNKKHYSIIILAKPTSYSSISPILQNEAGDIMLSLACCSVKHTPCLVGTTVNCFDFQR